MSTLFEDGNQPSKPFEDPNNVTLEDLVGEGRKYADVQALAKALAHSQNHISDLEATQQRFQQEADRMERLEQMLENLGKTPNEINSVTETQTEAPVTETLVVEPKESNKPQNIEELIERKFGEQEAQRKAEQNANQVRNKLIESLGDHEAAHNFFNKRIGELGMTASELDALASKNPSAALQLLAPPTVTQTPNRPTTFNRATVNAPPNPDNPVTVEDFNALRRKDFRKWSSPDIQRKLNKLVKE